MSVTTHASTTRQVEFCGRDGELEVITAALGHLGDGTSAVVVIEGGAGMGKSRLLAEVIAVARKLAEAVMRWEQVPAIPLFLDNTAAFVHDLPADAISNAAGASDYVRVQVLTPVGVLDREKQLGVVRELTDIVAAAAGDPGLVDRTWVLITEAPEGGWGIDGHANTGDDILAAARAALDATGD
jgi:phenylpyruvate tautomerase PptA (4-oxalocrotonate tautomerase family)